MILNIGSNNNYQKILYVFAQTFKVQNPKMLSLSTLIKEGHPFKGNISASVMILDFSDLQCILWKFVENTEQQINSTSVQTGKAVFIWMNLTNRGFDSFPDSLAAQCTYDQAKFWQYHNLLYKNQKGIDSGWSSKNNLKKMAFQIPSLDMQKFNSCFDNQKYKSFVEKDFQIALTMLGFTQTPSFVVVNSDGSNIQKIKGPQPYPEFKIMIDKERGTRPNNFLLY